MDVDGGGGGGGGLGVLLPLGMLVKKLEEGSLTGRIGNVYIMLIRGALVAVWAALAVDLVDTVGATNATPVPRVEMHDVTAATLSRVLVTAIAKDESGSLCLAGLLTLEVSD
jgi:hypothetical protein